MYDNEHESMKNVITLENGSTLSLFSNSDMVEDIKKTTKILELHINADQNSIANILGFADLVKKHWLGKIAFVVHLANKVVKFEATPKVLYQFKLPETYKRQLKTRQDPT